MTINGRDVIVAMIKNKGLYMTDQSVTSIWAYWTTLGEKSGRIG